MNSTNFDINFDRVAAFVDISAAKNNFLLAKQLCAGKKILCVLKANAYGHGAARLGVHYQKWGADMLGVASLAEGVALRQSGIALPILIFGLTEPQKADVLAAYGLCQTVFSEEYGVALRACAEQSGTHVNVHFKIDSGMHRLGFLSGKTVAQQAQTAKIITRLMRGGRLAASGIFTHFACGDGDSEFDKDFCQMQARRFEGVLAALEKCGAAIEIVHGGASAGLFNPNLPRYDMTRAGIALFGLYDGAFRREGFLPVMSVFAKVAQTKILKKGERTGYGGTFLARAEGQKIAVVCAGYADGVLRMLSGKGSVYAGGALLPIAGRVSMDQITVLCGDAALERGDSVMLFGREYTANEVAKSAGTIGYEVLCALSPRVERLYINE